MLLKMMMKKTRQRRTRMTKTNMKKKTNIVIAQKRKPMTHPSAISLTWDSFKSLGGSSSSKLLEGILQYLFLCCSVLQCLLCLSCSAFLITLYCKLQPLPWRRSNSVKPINKGYRYRTVYIYIEHATRRSLCCRDVSFRELHIKAIFMQCDHNYIAVSYPRIDLRHVACGYLSWHPSSLFSV